MFLRTVIIRSIVPVACAMATAALIIAAHYSAGADATSMRGVITGCSYGILASIVIVSLYNATRLWMTGDDPAL